LPFSYFGAHRYVCDAKIVAAKSDSSVTLELSSCFNEVYPIKFLLVHDPLSQW